MPQSKMSNAPRIRRELRTLSAKELSEFFDALKLMRTTGDAIGVLKYGSSFRSYDYLTIKHSTTAAHPCADQGHLPANQLTFHRALLLEFELSLLAILAIDAPTSTLDALPYWNWFIDTKRNRKGVNIDDEEVEVDGVVEQSWLQSSLWKYWGSPYGDPLNSFCISDPLFLTKITNVANVAPVLTKLQTAILNPRKQTAVLNPRKKILQSVSQVTTKRETNTAFANGFGYWRSPSSPSDCAGLTRNPGWMYGASTNGSMIFKQGTRDCLSGQYDTMTSFATCMQGFGGNTFVSSRGGGGRERMQLKAAGSLHFDFGPHNVPHVAMGTFDDAEFGYTLFFGILVFFIAVTLLLDLSCSAMWTWFCVPKPFVSENISEGVDESKNKNKNNIYENNNTGNSNINETSNNNNNNNNGMRNDNNNENNNKNNRNNNNNKNNSSKNINSSNNDETSDNDNNNNKDNNKDNLNIMPSDVTHVVVAVDLSNGCGDLEDDAISLQPESESRVTRNDSDNANKSPDNLNRVASVVEDTTRQNDPILEENDSLLVHPEAKSNRIIRETNIRLWCRRIGLTVAVSAGIAAPQIALSMRGIQGWKSFALWQQTLTHHPYGHDFTDSAWRLGDLNCPAPGSCIPGETKREECRCVFEPTVTGLLSFMSPLIGGVHNDFTGTDFWDGAFSINENFFFPIHGLYDLNHLIWANRGRTDNYKRRTDFGCPMKRVEVRKEAGGASLYDIVDVDVVTGRSVNGSCYGLEVDDVISHEMCFTPSDVGMPHSFAELQLGLNMSNFYVSNWNISISFDGVSYGSNPEVDSNVENDDKMAGPKPNPNRMHSSSLAHNPGEPCLTHADLLRWTIESCTQEVVPYTYDILQEEYSYVALEPEPSESVCPDVETVCKAIQPIQFEGTVKCRRNRETGNGRVHRPPPFGSAFERGQNEQNTENNLFVDMKLCERSTGRLKPDPPVKVCDCKAERLRAATFRHRYKVRTESPVFVVWSRCVGVAGAFICVLALRGTWLFDRCSCVRPGHGRYARLSANEDATS